MRSKRLTMRSRDSLGEAILIGDDAGNCEMNRAVQNAVNKLADYEDKEERMTKQTIADAEREFIGGLVEMILESTEDEDTAMIALQFCGAWQMMTLRWDADE